MCPNQTKAFRTEASSYESQNQQEDIIFPLRLI